MRTKMMQLVCLLIVVATFSFVLLVAFLLLKVSVNSTTSNARLVARLVAVVPSMPMLPRSAPAAPRPPSIQIVKNVEFSGPVMVAQTAPRPCAVLSVVSTISIVDFLRARGLDSSFAARETLAHDAGMGEYNGTQAQNLELLDRLQADLGTSASTTQGVIGASSNDQSRPCL